MSDSTVKTYEHIRRVQELLTEVIAELVQRMMHHDETKTQSPEVEVFEEYTPKLATLVYGSDEYREALRGMKPALDHHYAANRHHPEHFENGIRGMNLIDLIELICDWKAASERGKNPRASLENGQMKLSEASPIQESIRTINQERFGYTDELKEILLNTLEFLEENDE